MSRDEVVAFLKQGKMLTQIGTLSLQSKFESGEVVAHQVMQSLAYGDFIKRSDDQAPNPKWVLHI